MKGRFALTAVLGLLCLGSPAQAVTIDTVFVGDPGNDGELSGAGAGGSGPNRICGSVGYSYSIGKYEVTVAQYTDFLNKVARTDTYGLYSTYMDTAIDSYGCNIRRGGSSGTYTYTIGNGTTDVLLWANRPVNYVSYWDACRFANWLHNGQPMGLQTAATTERGAYTLDGYTGQKGRDIQRNAGWKWAVTSEDEWYKAAYYKSGGTTAGYWDYPMQSNTPTTPSNDITDPDGGNNANFYQNGYTLGSPYYRTNAGEFEDSESAYGTFDQGGNVWEWNEAIVYEDSTYAYRGLRGGCSESNASYYLQASYRGYYVYGTPADEYDILGFRVSAVPEPSSILALVSGLLPLLGAGRLRRSR